MSSGMTYEANPCSEEARAMRHDKSEVEPGERRMYDGSVEALRIDYEENYTEQKLQ